MKKNKGFTLLELLVVIAIIGILATIVMVSLQGARRRAQDAAIQAQLSSARAAAELFHTGSGTYIGMHLVATDGAEATGFPAIYDAVRLISGTGDTDVIISPSVTSYCFAARKVSDSTQFFCVDSSGVMETDASCGGAGTAASPYACQ